MTVFDCGILISNHVVMISEFGKESLLKLKELLKQEEGISGGSDLMFFTHDRDHQCSETGCSEMGLDWYQGQRVLRQVVKTLGCMKFPSSVRYNYSEVCPCDGTMGVVDPK